MNSFRFLERGVEAELERQAALLDGRRAGRAGDASLRPAQRLADPAALEGVRARLPLLPRARPGPAGADRGDDRGRRGRRCPSCPRERRERYASELGLAEKLATQLAFDAELGAYFERGARGAPAASSRRVVANWVTGELSPPARGGTRADADPAASKVTRGAGELAGMVEAKRGLARGRARRCWRRWSPRAASPAEIVEREGLGADRTTPSELEAIVERAIEADPEAAERVREGNMKAIGPAGRLRDARDQGPRRRGEVPG